MGEQSDLFEPQILFCGVVAHFNSGSGPTFRWSACRYDVGVSFEGWYVTPNWVNSKEYVRREDLEREFGAERPLPRKVESHLRKQGLIL